MVLYVEFVEVLKYIHQNVIGDHPDDIWLIFIDIIITMTDIFMIIYHLYFIVSYTISNPNYLNHNLINFRYNLWYYV